MSLLMEIDRYLRATAMPETRFGRIVAGDPRLVHDLRHGRQAGSAMVRRVRCFIATASRP